MNSLTVTHIDHCSIIITDVPKARHFYSNLLGLHEIAPPTTFDFVALWYDLGGTYLHLLLKEKADTISPRHFCLRVRDCHQARDYLTQKGIPIEETVKIPSAERFFIRDPDGNRIEILQWIEPYDPKVNGNFRV